MTRPERARAPFYLSAPRTGSNYGCDGEGRAILSLYRGEIEPRDGLDFRVLLSAAGILIRPGEAFNLRV